MTQKAQPSIWVKKITQDFLVYKTGNIKKKTVNHLHKSFRAFIKQNFSSLLEHKCKLKYTFK